MRWTDLLVGRLSSASRVFIVIVAVGHPVTVRAVPNVWTSIGPDGGSILSIAVDRTSPTTMYAGATGAGFFASFDGGLHWTPRGNLAGKIVSDIRIDPTHSTILYARADHLPEGTALFRSTDGGQMWTVLTIAGGFHGETSSFVIDPGNSQILYAALGAAGVYKSEDRGRTWYRPSNAFPDPGITLLAIDPNDPTTLYGGALYGVFKSTDAAQHWEPVKGNGLPDGEIDVQSLAIDPGNSDTVYAGTLSGFFRSTDASGTWTAIDADLPNPPIVDSVVFDPNLPETIYIIGPGNCGDFFCTGTVYRSSSGSTPWLPLDTLRSLGLMQSFMVVPNGNLYAGTDSGPGILKSTDRGFKWEPSGTGITNRTVRTFFVTEGESETLYADLVGTLMRRTGLQDWYTVKVPDLVQPSFAISPTDPVAIFAAEGHGSRIVRSTDAGSTWQEVGSLGDVVDLHIAPHSPATLYAAAANGVFKSTDAGAHWTSLNNGLPPDGSAHALTLSPDGRTLFVIVEICPVYGNDAPYDQLYRTNDEGKSWMEIVPYSNRISGTAVDPLVPTRLYLFGFDGVAKSLDGGTTWEAPTLPHMFVASLALDSAHPDTIYAGTQTGMFKSTDGATSWRPFNTGLTLRTGPLPEVTALLVSSTDPTTVYAGTARNSAFVIQQVAACNGDCNVDGKVTVDELVKGVGIMLGATLLSDCPEFDCHGNNDVGVDCVLQAVNAALKTCIAR